MKNIKGLSVALISGVMLTCSVVQTTSIAYYNSQIEHIGDMINQSSELKVSGLNIHSRKIMDESSIQKIVDIYRDSKKKQLNNGKIKSFDLQLIFPENVKIELITKDVDGNYIGRCAIGGNWEYFETKENIGDKINEIIMNTNKYIEEYKEGEIIREGDSVVSSVELSKATYPSAENVIITGPNGTPDSLASAPLAGYLSSPILITEKDNLRFEVENEIKRLGAKNVYITSGNNVVSHSVKNKLIEKGYNVVDLSDSDRYKTAERISSFILKNSNKSEKIILINGENYADAPSISAFAYRNYDPILLTNGKILRKSTMEIIRKNKNLLIVGGKNSVPTIMEERLKDELVNVGRLEGIDRYETSMNIVNGLFTNNSRLLLSDGKNDLGVGIISAGYCSENKRPLLMIKKGNKLNEHIRSKNLIYLTKEAYNDLK